MLLRGLPPTPLVALPLVALVAWIGGCAVDPLERAWSLEILMVRCVQCHTQQGCEGECVSSEGSNIESGPTRLDFGTHLGSERVVTGVPRAVIWTHLGSERVSLGVPGAVIWTHLGS